MLHLSIVSSLWQERLRTMGGLWTYLTGSAGPSGFGSRSTAEDVTAGIDLSSKTIIISGDFLTLRRVVCLQARLCMSRRVAYPL